MEVSAPGKLIITGEYAVLSGAPAVVMAISRRALVKLHPGGSTWTLEAPELEVRHATFQLTARGCRWKTGRSPSAIVDGVVTTLVERGILSPDMPPATLITDTGHLWDRQSGSKLGFGSSAAITTALTRALTRYAGSTSLPWHTFDAELFSLLRGAHEAGQGNMGSGVDIAASQLGGALIYSNQPQNLYAKPLVLPAELHWLAVWTGRAASTTTRLKALTQFSTLKPAIYERQMASLRLCADAAAVAFSKGKVAPILEAIAHYRTQVAGFGAAVGIDVFSRPHQELAALADSCGVVYKSSGAGGGDLGIAFSACPDTLADFRRRIPDRGYQAMDLHLDPQGVKVDSWNR